MKRVPALEFREVSYALNGKKIIDSLSWIVRPGEHWAILGPSGAGKTTLLKLACGYVWPNAGGEIYRKGRRLLDLRELRKSIGWVTSTLASQVPPREPVLRTVVSGKFAQIGLVEGLWWRPTRGDYALARACLAEMACARLQEREFAALSQGEQQKVLIARARMTKPYLIFLDEPCAGMDPGARENFLATLTRLGRRKRMPSLIYVTHHVEEILPQFRKTLVLKDGRVVRAGRTSELLSEKVLEELYGVSFRLLRRRGRYWPIPKPPGPLSSQR